VRLPISPRYALAIEDWFAHENQRLKRSPNSNRLCRDCQRLFSNTVSSQMTKDEGKKLPPDEKEHFMKCLVCGEMFDPRSLDEVLFHHDHKQRPDIPYSGSERVKAAAEGLRAF